MRNILASGLFVLTSYALAANSTVFEITDNSSTGEVRTVLTTMSAIAEPADLPVPVFHFDATRTNGWTFNAEGTRVTKIPSLVGERYLANSLGDGDAKQLYNGSINPAGWVPSVPELGGLPAIDFGDRSNASQRAMFFDPIENDGSIDSEYNPVNLIKGVGTVVAVFRPQPDASVPFLGGGFIKGSPWGAGDTVCYGENWKRGSASVLGGGYWVPVFYGYRGPMGGSYMYHNGLKTDSTEAGFTGDWEIAIFQPTEAKWETSGIGLSKIDSVAYDRGGSKWAELYIFDQVVDENILERLNVYLTQKWFGGRKTVGWNKYSSIGNVRVYRSGWTSYGGTNIVTTAEGETVKIDRLAGGRGRESVFIKEGEGTLEIGNAAHFGGDIVLKGGKLALSAKETPTLETLPSELSFRFDASDTSTMDIEVAEDGEYINTWKNLTEKTTTSGSEIYARGGKGNSAKRPWLVRDALGPGLHTIDFGEYNTANTTDPERYAARYFDFTYLNDDTLTAFTVPSVYTVVAVIGAQRSGGNIIGNGNASVFARHNANVDWLKESQFSVPLLRENSVNPSGYAVVYPITNSCVMIDGVVVDPMKGYQTPGFQVVAIKTTAQGMRFIGGTETRQGGLNISELLIWQRPLEESEMRDVQAYLTKKWFRRDLEGYRSEGHALPEARTVVAEGASEIHVPEGKTVRVEGVTANAKLRKTGGGTLEVGPFGAAGESSIEIAEGSIKPVPALDTVADASAPAVGASLHLDAADPKSVYLVPGSTSGEVWCWHDKSHRSTAYQMTSGKHPIYSASGATLNGVPVVDCQPDDVKRGFLLPRALDGVRAVFVVWQPLEGGTILGANSKFDASGTAIDYTRANDKQGLIIENGTSYATRAGEFYTDGERVTVAIHRFVPEEKFQITEIYPIAATHVSGITCDRGTLTGNARYAEIILYERELSEREKVATRNYLTKKWFPDRELQPLPATEDAVLPGSVTYASNSVFPVTVGSDGTAVKISVSGTIAFEEDVRFEIAGFSNVSDPDYTQLILANAENYTGLANLENAVILADGTELTGSSRPIFKVTDDNDLVMKFCPYGLLIEIR